MGDYYYSLPKCVCPGAVLHISLRGQRSGEPAAGRRAPGPRRTSQLPGSVPRGHGQAGCGGGGSGGGPAHLQLPEEISLLFPWQTGQGDVLNGIGLECTELAQAKLFKPGWLGNKLKILAWIGLGLEGNGIPKLSWAWVKKEVEFPSLV